MDEQGGTKWTEGTPSASSFGDANVVYVFHAPKASEVIRNRLTLYPMLPDDADPDLMIVRFVEVPQETKKISARQSWRDPWPGRRR